MNREDISSLGTEFRLPPALRDHTLLSMDGFEDIWNEETKEAK